MSWKCDNCGQPLKGTEIYCPKCAAKTVYYCTRCNKEMDNGKHKLCPLCRTERNEKVINTVKKAGATVGSVAVAAGSVVLGVVTKGKIGKS